MNIEHNIKQIQNHLPETVKLIAISKTKPIEDILAAYNAGQRRFGENKVRELTSKYEQLPKDIEWHLVGHLQSNKVKYVAPFVALIHSVDSFGLLQEINKQALKNNRIINCLLQVHIAKEETKFGLSESELFSIFENPALGELKNISIVGLMGMATFTDDTRVVHSEFKTLKQLFETVKLKYFAQKPEFCEISMGMSDDFEIAVSEGSTMVRVGSSIFGERIYFAG
jgi:PLP dependent protein